MIDLREKAGKVNAILEKYLPADTKEFGQICEAMNYSVLVGGKRLRAIMLLESFRLFNTDPEMEELLAYPYAASIEFIHAYSLVHDDLPSMDNDMYRRGMLTTHAKFGHAMGVLTGDALLNYAFETMSGSMNRITQVHGEIVNELYGRAARAMYIIASRAGYSGMIGGQVIDVCVNNTAELTDSSAIKAQLLKTYELKTSDLFRAALCAGAVLGGASDEYIKRLDKFGYHLGLAFQIRDDILDKTSTLEQLGKDINSDEKNGKQTIAGLLGLQQASVLVDTELNTAEALLDELPGDTSFLKELVNYLRSREK